MAKKSKAKKNQKEAAGKPERQPPGQGMTLMLGVVTIALIAIAAYALYSQQGEQEISPSEFQALLQNETRAFVVVQDLRAVPEGDASARQNLQNCGIFLMQNLPSMLDREADMAAYAFGADGACVGGTDAASIRTVDECISEIEKEGRLKFTIAYNPLENKTRFYSSGAVFQGDTAFLAKCDIATMFSN